MSSEDTRQDLLVDQAATDPERPPPAYLVHIHPPGPNLGVCHPLTGAATVLGRDGECDIWVADLSVSRHHARFEADKDGFWVEDLGSTNGLFVNKVPVSRCRLRDGDDLRLGNCVYRFLDSGNVEAQYHALVRRLTVSDGLTQVPNRRYFEQVLTRELLRSTRYHRPLALVLFDIDHFKAINDERGHVAGDWTLRELAARIQANVRQEGLVARYGGEEFAVILPEAGLEAAAQVAERIRRRVAEQPFDYHGRMYSITVSLGVAATRGEEPLTCEEFLGRADANLYQAKRQGRNRVVAERVFAQEHSPSRTAAASATNGLAATMPSAVRS